MQVWEGEGGRPLALAKGIMTRNSMQFACFKEKGWRCVVCSDRPLATAFPVAYQAISKQKKISV